MMYVAIYLNPQVCALSLLKRQLLDLLLLQW